jgi:hypothetical protein
MQKGSFLRGLLQTLFLSTKLDSLSGFAVPLTPDTHVHHRHRGDDTQLVTLSAGCHARVHRTWFLRRWLPEILVLLWRKWHPDSVEQLQRPVEMSAVVPSGAGWQIFSGFPARIVGGQPPEDESEGGGKDSRVFFPDPAQYRFDWATSPGGQEGSRV